MSQVLHPDNKIEYNEGDEVEIVLDGNIKNIMNATICGKASEHIIDFWIVKLDNKIHNYQYSCLSVQHTFIRPKGDNRPFLCEGISRTF